MVDYVACDIEGSIPLGATRVKSEIPPVLARYFQEVSRARRERERQRQPEVIKAAGEYLSLMSEDADFVPVDND